MAAQPRHCGAIIKAIVLAAVLGLTAATAAAQDHDIAAPADLPHADRAGTDLSGAVADSLKLLLFEHAARVAFQEKTRRELGGPFWGDYQRSVRMPGQWGDTDSWRVNYVGHPIHGAAAAHIWRDRESLRARANAWSRDYWASVVRATAWSAAYSVQFEIGPFSEASIGNVGLKPETTGWVDYIVTPAGAMGLLVAEDVLDRLVTQPFERRIGNRAARVVVRLAMSPGRTLANTARGAAPWHRPDRSLNERANRR
jgi:hypothetical protein